MGKKNGKWVVGVLLLSVAALAYFAVIVKKDMMKRGPRAEAAAEQAAE
ncbi:MAG: hypothetical protein ACI92G_004349 [Candidatus Pelagisphaera sp.]|jgi:hypothetical protein|tara:strand:+ start:128 stop:271 length:144 start_codon:yes stop_codon:yes gene_type:complete